MIVLLGARGYVGEAFQRALRLQKEPFRALSRAQVDYSRYDTLLEFLRQVQPRLLINASGYTGKPNVDACELARADALQGNTLCPLTIAHACAATSTPWAQVSSGCIYRGAILVDGGIRRVETDMTTPAMQRRVATNPDTIHGFTETDEPNFSFRHPPCSFYSGTKALAEEVLRDAPQLYLWRLRIPFNQIDHPRNYLSKLQRYPKLYDNVNSLSHLDDAVRACLELWQLRAPFGIYNVTNPGYVTTRQVVAMIQRVLRSRNEFAFWRDDEEFYREAVKTPRSNCVLDTTKLQAAGVNMRPVEEAIEDALTRWQPEPS